MDDKYDFFLKTDRTKWQKSVVFSTNASYPTNACLASHGSSLLPCEALTRKEKTLLTRRMLAVGRGR